MKKLFLSLMVSLSFLVAAEEYGLMQSLLDRQTALAIAINTYIEDRGSVPPSITVLKNANYLPLAYVGTNPFDKDALSFSISNYQIRIDSNVESATRKADQVLYYINSIKNRDLDRRSTQEGGKLISYYALSAKAATNLNLSSFLSYATFKGDTDPSLYQSVTAGALWFSSQYDMYQVKLYDGSSWKTLEKGNKNFSHEGLFVNLNTLPILKSSWKFTNVDVNTIQKAIKCFVNGTTYNPFKDRCEAYTSNACDAADNFRTATGLCDQGNDSACVGGTFDLTEKICLSTQPKTSKSVLVQEGCFSALNNPCQQVCVAFDPTTNQYKYKLGGMSSYATFTGTTTNWSAASYGCWWRNEGEAVRITNIVPMSGTPTTVCYHDTLHNTTSCSVSSYNGAIIYLEGWDAWYGVRMSGAASISNGYKTLSVCDNGMTDNGTNCIKKTTPSCSLSGYAHDGVGRCAKTPTCNSKTMPIAPYYATPHYGNNGVCYSDAGLYCSTYGVSMDGLYTCFNYQFGCDDSSYNLRTDTDVCEKFNFSCSSGKRYGLPDSPTNNDATDLYNRITNKDDKMTAIASTITKNDYNTNDNNGAMCTAVQFTTFPQPTISIDYTIGGETKSGF